jgi:hypothetical protein
MAVVNQCHDLYPARVSKDDGPPAPAPEPADQLEYA